MKRWVAKGGLMQVSRVDYLCQIYHIYNWTFTDSIYY